MCEDLLLLTHHTSFNVVLDPGSHIGPPEELLGFAYRLILSGVSSGVSVVDVHHEFPPEALVRWDNQSVIFGPRLEVTSFRGRRDMVFELPLS